ncbi:transposase [Streptomyces sp. NPDC005065]|uniref:transposase n=1 Tax=unclassified Streptomyces TaxID=2593676 RepID=UPI0033B5AEA3
MHVLSDADGLPLRVGLSAANTHDSQALKPMLSHFHMGHEFHAAESNPRRLHADKAYDAPHLRKWLWGKHIGVRIARKGIESSERLARRRWVIERTMPGSPATAESTIATSDTRATTWTFSASQPHSAATNASATHHVGHALRNRISGGYSVLRRSPAIRSARDSARG